eukprot:2712151-Pyramimonas_sp.AAC.1
MAAVVLRYVLHAAVVIGTQLTRCSFYAQLPCSAEDLRSKRVTCSLLLFPSPALAGGIRDGGCESNPYNTFIYTPYPRSLAPGRLGSGGKDIHLSLLSSTNVSGVLYLCTSTPYTRSDQTQFQGQVIKRSSRGAPRVRQRGV